MVRGVGDRQCTVHNVSLASLTLFISVKCHASHVSFFPSWADPALVTDRAPLNSPMPISHPRLGEEVKEGGKGSRGGKKLPDRPDVEMEMQ